jgi:hypothetical protein
MDEYGGTLKSYGTSSFHIYNWHRIALAFARRMKTREWQPGVKEDQVFREVTLISPSGDEVYHVEFGRHSDMPDIISVQNDKFQEIVRFEGRTRALLFPGGDSEVDISNSDMPRNMLELFKRILTYPEIAIGEQDESGSADMAKRMAKKIGWRVDAGGYAM